MNKQDFLIEVAKLLGYENRPPHEVYRQIESCYLQQMSPNATVAAISEAGGRVQ